MNDMKMWAVGVNGSEKGSRRHGSREGKKAKLSQLKIEKKKII